MHEHEWNFLSEIASGDSVDTYHSCRGCSSIQHVYTYDPGNIRHEKIVDGNSFEAGYAHGLARMAREYAHIGGLE